MSGNNRRVSYDGIYSDSFSVDHIPKQIIKFIGNKNFIRSIYRIKVYNSIIYGYFCIWIINFMLKGKSILYYTIFLRRMIK